MRPPKDSALTLSACDLLYLGRFPGHLRGVVPQVLRLGVVSSMKNTTSRVIAGEATRGSSQGQEVQPVGTGLTPCPVAAVRAGKNVGRDRSMVHIFATRAHRCCDGIHLSLLQHCLGGDRPRSTWELL